MRYTRLLTLPLLGALFAMPVRAPAQLNLNIRFGTRLGPEIGVFAYAPDRVGDWRTNYPKTDENKCIACGLCWIYCPDRGLAHQHPALDAGDLVRGQRSLFHQPSGQRAPGVDVPLPERVFPATE